MTGELVPELHDIGKLTDAEPHNFENIDLVGMGISPNTPIWKGILEHSVDDNWAKYPSSIDTFILSIADGLACAVSRLPRQGVSPEKRYYCLWRGYQQQKWTPIKQEEAARFVASAPSANQYFTTYGDFLKQRAEEAKANVTSLYTHSGLVGKLYRLMKKASFPIQDTEIVGKSKAELKNLRELKGQQWKLKLMVLQPHFWITPWRTKDLGVFTQLQECMQEIAHQWPDNLLFITPRQALLIVESDHAAQAIREVFLQKGYWLKAWELPVQPSRELKSLKKEADIIELVPNEKTIAYYPDFFGKTELIPIPICPACQKAPASKLWTSGDTLEELCPICYSFREKGERLHKLEDWTLEKVAWVHIYLDFNCLLKSLRELLNCYWSDRGVTRPESEVRFSLIAEFHSDYEKLVSRIDGELDHIFPERERLMPGFLCLKLQSEREILDILRVFDEAIDDIFPKFRELALSPIRIGISSSIAKFPFFEHWRLLNEFDDSVLVHLIGRGDLKCSLKALPHVLTVANMPGKSALNKLAEVATISEQLAKLKLHDRQDRDSRTYRELREKVLPLGLSHKSLITLAKIAGG